MLAAALPAYAGGDVFRVYVRDFRREGAHGARFTAVVANDEEPLPGGCRELNVASRYAWWKWLWTDVGGLVNRPAQRRALDVLQDAASRGALVGFGYIGAGWQPVRDQEPCRV